MTLVFGEIKRSLRHAQSKLAGHILYDSSSMMALPYRPSTCDRVSDRYTRVPLFGQKEACNLHNTKCCAASVACLNSTQRVPAAKQVVCMAVRFEAQDSCAEVMYLGLTTDIAVEFIEGHLSCEAVCA